MKMFNVYKETPERIKMFKSFKWALILTDKPRDLTDLLYRLIWRNELTYYANRESLKVIKIQPSGVSRSAMDIYRICHSYNPKFNYEIVGKILTDLCNNDLIKHGYCSNVKKEVHNPKSLNTRREQIAKVLGVNNIKF